MVMKCKALKFMYDICESIVCMSEKYELDQINIYNSMRCYVTIPYVQKP